ncbi:putative Rho-type GTPase-activating protein 2 [Cladobotryum mycophilum]|uniref:Rho-type GTPase-activating protein 2 n=1 Tax=Cladobotryum mycophilum TaxID=491253 RepID=A0ABR0SF60_9HYPO
MGRKPTPQPLTLAGTNDQASSETASPAVASPADSRSPRSLRSSPFTTTRFGHSKNYSPQTGRSITDESSQQQQQLLQQQQQRHNPSARDDLAATSSYNYPPISSAFNPSSSGIPSHGIRHVVTEGSKPTKSFFQFNKGSKSVSQFPTTQTHQYSESRSQILSRGSDGAADVSKHRDDTLHRPFPTFPSLSDLSISSSIADNDSAPSPSTSRKNKSKSFGLLSRSRSNRDPEIESPKISPMPLPTASSNHTLADGNTPLRTAPVAQDRAFRDMMNSSVRNRSEDRAFCRDVGVGKENHHREKDHKEKEHRVHSSALRDTGASALFSGLRNSSTRAADLLSKGLFGKASRSGSTTHREPAIDDEHYVLKVINLPLVEQTRLTRISKRLEDSKDKTEFWMPAFPWRAIDYLNYKGCEVEGLYRVPGSGPQIKKWQRRFDEQYDVNLFDETDLYDINIVGSMLKAWLRELPDELFPKEAQERIARECAGASQVPQLLIEELSNLPPFNYYLLFAITCHLSLLLAHSDKNKMDFRNLCICFQPCMRIDAFCFKFLVCDWRECWRGCKYEARYIEEEYMVFDQPPPRGLSDVQSPQQPAIIRDERQPSPPILELPPGAGNGGGRLNKHQLQLTKSTESMASKSSTISTEMTVDSENETEANSSGVPGLTPAPTIKSRDLRPLSPIQPLSPLGF